MWTIPSLISPTITMELIKSHLPQLINPLPIATSNLHVTIGIWILKSSTSFFFVYFLHCCDQKKYFLEFFNVSFLNMLNFWKNCQIFKTTKLKNHIGPQCVVKLVKIVCILIYSWLLPYLFVHFASLFCCFFIIKLGRFTSI
jgi:hypothetical protein